MDKNTTTIVMDPIVFKLFDAISISASIASLLLAIIAIWLTLHFKQETDRTNKQTEKLLLKIKAESKVMKKFIMSELRKAYGDIRNNFGNNIATDDNTFPGSPDHFSAVGNNTEDGVSREVKHKKKKS